MHIELRTRLNCNAKENVILKMTSQSLKFLRDYSYWLNLTSAQVVQTSVSVTTNSPSQDYTVSDDHISPTHVWL